MVIKLFQFTIVSRLAPGLALDSFFCFSFHYSQNYNIFAMIEGLLTTDNVSIFQTTRTVKFD